MICAFTVERLPSMREAIAALTAAPLPPREIVLVVDHSPELLERANGLWPEVKVVASSHPKGLSGARNAGTDDCVGEVVAFLDDDAIPDPDWIERLGESYADPAVLGVGGTVRPRWLAGRPGWFPSEFAWVVGCTHSGMPRERSAVRNVIGANMSFRRDALIAVGGFRREFGRVGKNAAGAEETDLCIRIGQRHRGAIVYDPAVAVEHLVPATRGRNRYFLTRCFGEGRSKAVLAGLVGSDAGLADERTYVRRTLPRGVLRDLGAALRGDVAGLGRATMIGTGLLATTIGYLSGLRRRAATASR